MEVSYLDMIQVWNHFVNLIKIISIWLDAGIVSGAMLLIEDDENLAPVSTIWKEMIVSATVATAWLFSLIGAPATQRSKAKKYQWNIFQKENTNLEGLVVNRWSLQQVCYLLLVRSSWLRCLHLKQFCWLEEWLVIARNL